MQSVVSIIIVTWNKRDDVLYLLDSLLAIDYPSFKIIVVDNASTDGSAEAIRRHPLSVILIENPENLGGTGGFNTGICFALENLSQDYIWLLDNDAQVMPDTLQKLIAVMDADASVGVAGSCILNPDDHTLIVEAGAFVDKSTVTWIPNLRFHTYSEYKEFPPVDVDYVPACSALIRHKVFDAAGVLDERYFLHWDDVDFSTRVRKTGYRVVAVLGSVVFHGTEKGYSNSTLYYDLRNSLLFVSKYLSFFRRVLPVFRICLRGILAARLFETSGERLLSWYIYEALQNFSLSRFGAAPPPPSQLVKSVEAEAGACSADELSDCKNVVVFAIGSSSEIRSVIERVHSIAPTASITLAAPSDRIGSYHSSTLIDRFISYDLARLGIWGVAAVGFKLLRNRFDFAVSAGSGFIIPYAFFVRRHVVSINSGKRFVESKICLSSSWKLPFILTTGILFSLPYTLMCLRASQRIAAGWRITPSCKIFTAMRLKSR